jgi:hypothetical protein
MEMSFRHLEKVSITSYFTHYFIETFRHKIIILFRLTPLEYRITSAIFNDQTTL